MGLAIDITLVTEEVKLQGREVGIKQTTGVREIAEGRNMHSSNI